ncbi:polysaccharide pyruvyl transferase family protein [Synechococcus sp. 1G10]|uniref:polysaccharide pyruvyl transferase family protein n=1 Tax=Synechococcus sp. 1G10 TaxID=2025605 RepID=UPI001303E73E|nr:polysaccharide pyruvyl transferase family protein [Synechococcus sp. 1G10]
MSTTPVEVVHHVFANRSNVGDWLSARAIQGLLGANRINEHLCDESFVDQALEALADASPRDAVVIGGGGLFMDYFTPFWEGFEPLSTRLRFAVWGVGNCDLKQESSLAPQDLLRRVVSRSPFILLRDRSSGDRLQLSGLRMPMPCPGLLGLSRHPLGDGLLHVDNYTTAGAATYERMEAVASRVAAAEGWSLCRTNNRIPHGDTNAFDVIIDLYAASSLVLSSALHGCVIAVAMGRPVLAVSGDRKIDAFMQAVGLGDWVLEADPALLPESLLEERLRALPQQQRLDPQRLAEITAGHKQFAIELRSWLGLGPVASQQEVP